jgi:hypothetical protein
MEPRDEIERKLLEKLMQIEPKTARNPKRAADGLAAFLQESGKHQRSVTKLHGSRHIGWKQILNQVFSIRQKEYSPMSTIVTILLAGSLLFGAGGVTVVAAQNSMPSDTLYGLKIWSEGARLSIITNPETDFQLSLEFMGRRAEELQKILQSGEVPAEGLLQDYQNRIEQTFRFAASLPADQSIQAIELVRSRLLIQKHTFEQSTTGITGDQVKVRDRIMDMLQTRINWSDNGMNDPGGLLDTLNNADGFLQPDETGSGGNPWTTGTPTPGSGYGPGQGDGLTCTPNAYDHSGNPYTTGTPTPGSGYGPGAAGGVDPTAQKGYQPETGQSQNEASGGNTSSTPFPQGNGNHNETH